MIASKANGQDLVHLARSNINKHTFHCMRNLQKADYLQILSSIADPGQWQSCNSLGKVAGSDAAKLYFLARATDTAGSGTAVINIKDCVNLLERSPKTINRYLRAGKKLKFFRAIKPISSNLVRVYYSSVSKLAVHLGIHDLGAIATTPATALKNLKRTSTELQALEVQRRSQYKQRRKKVSGREIDIARIVTRPSAHGSGVLHATPRYIYLTEDNQLVGGSQKKIAWEQCRSVSTVQRRLSTLSPVQKRQLAQTKPEYLREFFSRLHIGKPTDGFFRLPDYPHLCFKAATCIYHLADYTLSKHKCLRAKVKRALKRAKEGGD